MKTLIVCCSVALYSLQLIAAPPSDPVDKVQFSSQKVFMLPDGKTLEAPNQVTFPFDIIVRTNGTFTVKGGTPRQLQEGETLGNDGMLIKPDGSIVPVIDHVTMNRGKVMMFKDGVASEVSATVQLSDGTSISADGKITPRDGAPRRLLDGELFKLDGGSLPAQDTITMKNGRVIVQKDGSQLVVEPGRSIMMNDGTKVLGDGTIIKFDGDQIAVNEGQIYTLDGVARRSR